MPKPRPRSERALTIPAAPIQGAISEWLNGRGDRSVKTLSLEAHVSAGLINSLIGGRMTTLTVAWARKLLTTTGRLDVLDALLPDAKPVVPARDGAEWVPAADLMLVLRERYLLHRPGASIYKLAEASGISAKTIESWESGETSFVRFNIADRVLTKGGMVDAWFNSGLRRFYGAEEEAA